MQFCITHDMELVRSVLTHPKIYPHIVDDGCPPASEYIPQDLPTVWYVRVDDDGEFLGLFVFTRESTATWEVHTCLLPVAYGLRAWAAALTVVEWLWANSPAHRLITKVPETNRLALKLAERAGFERYGLNPKSFLKFGVLLDQILLGVSRPEKETTSCL